jgi:hypothetical protein
LIPEPELDRSNLDEAKITVFGLIVSRCEPPEILQLVEAPFNAVAHRVDIAVNVDSHFPVLSHWNNGRSATGFHVLPDMIGVVATVRNDDFGSRATCRHYDFEPDVVRGLAICQFGADWKSVGIRA